MPRRDPTELMSEIGNWNTADRYSESEIMGPLRVSSIYRNIAKHGFSSLLEEYISPEARDVDKVRLDGMRWLVSSILLIIENSKAFLKKKGTKDQVDEYEKKLKRIEKLLDMQVLYKIKTDNVNGERKIVLEKQKFDAVLEIVTQIRTDIKEPLNKNDLIFIDKEQIDIKEFKQKILEDATMKG